MTSSREQVHSLADTRDSGNGSPPAGSPLSNLAVQIVASRATELARAGRYDDAEALLRDLVPAGLPAPALDLLARIRAQQGRLAEAKALWVQLSQLNPCDQATQAALRRIARIEGRHHGTGSPRPPAFARLRRFMCRQQAAEKTQPSDALLELTIRVPGVVLQEADDEVIVTFNFSPFSGPGATLQKKGKDVLSALGWQLEPYVGRIAIEVVGQPDALPPDGDALPRDVSALGMARAVAVFTHLTETTKLQARMFSLRTGEDFLTARGSDASDTDIVCPPIVLHITRVGW